MVNGNIDQKYLRGLKYRTSEARTVVEGGRKAVKHTPVERQLRLEDVLDWKDSGDWVVIVTADGQKATVLKEPRKDEK